MFNIDKAYQLKKERNWEYVYWCIDLHNTIIKTLYTNGLGYEKIKNPEFFPCAEEVLQYLTNKKDVVLILWTSSHQNEIENIDRLLKEHGIRFDHFNNNPIEQNNGWSVFDTGKFYFNILLDDKAGFDGNTDWIKIKEELIRIGEWEYDQQKNNR
jgi:hypothetical protein